MMLLLGGRPRDFDVVFMDCDGVLFDSNAMKSDAIAAAVAGYPPGDVTRLVELHLDQGGISRHAKLRRFFTEIHPVDDVEAALAEALDKFGAHSKRAYAALDPIPAALDFVEALRGCSVNVVSGTDQAELREVFAAKGLMARFADVLGSPTTKPVHLRRVLDAAGVAAARAVMIGDGRGDFQAAREVGMPFVFLAAYSDWASAAVALEGEPNVYVARDWAELSSWLPSGDGHAQ
ncbi:MAG: HAD hydrolase-like protein [Deltaproteobacteria bacterium]